MEKSRSQPQASLWCGDTNVPITAHTRCEELAFCYYFPCSASTVIPFRLKEVPQSTTVAASAKFSCHKIASFHQNFLLYLIPSSVLKMNINQWSEMIQRRTHYVSICCLTLLIKKIEFSCKE